MQNRVYYTLCLACIMANDGKSVVGAFLGGNGTLAPRVQPPPSFSDPPLVRLCLGEPMHQSTEAASRQLWQQPGLRIQRPPARPSKRQWRGARGPRRQRRPARQTLGPARAKSRQCAGCECPPAVSRGSTRGWRVGWGRGQHAEQRRQVGPKTPAAHAYRASPSTMMRLFFGRWTQTLGRKQGGQRPGTRTLGGAHAATERSPRLLPPTNLPVVRLAAVALRMCFWRLKAQRRRRQQIQRDKALAPNPDSGAGERQANVAGGARVPHPESRVPCCPLCKASCAALTRRRPCEDQSPTHDRACSPDCRAPRAQSPNGAVVEGEVAGGQPPAPRCNKRDRTWSPSTCCSSGTSQRQYGGSPVNPAVLTFCRLKLTRGPKSCSGEAQECAHDASPRARSRCVCVCVCVSFFPRLGALPLGRARTCLQRPDWLSFQGQASAKATISAARASEAKPGSTLTPLSRSGRRSGHGRRQSRGASAGTACAYSARAFPQAGQKRSR